MRKLMMAVMAVAGLGVVTGCERRPVQEAQGDLTAAQQELGETRQEAQQEVQQELAEARQEAQEEVADARQEVREQREDLAEARQERQQEMQQQQEVEGRVQTASPDALVLVIPEENNRQMRFQANQQTQVMRDGQRLSIADLQPGDEIRASYMVTQDGNLVLNSIDVEQQDPAQPMQQDPAQPMQQYPDQPMQE